ncbi:hypothetical protein DLAC_08907 [Tieghemostelium lacteum]|uniref:ASPIC/UnbV domain-containing protein n=1 Tax=Tieghemostelium lacteum TaxID=361077 RepID=A0A151Z8M3_TIELA|nr:hypothetical protein DLAC_08907 [Tieghemostelium lacteum]|eukprot:KYQ90305.1 hypothetical protein DLAC_08907 [Tieghemostelium lacteum]
MVLSEKVDKNVRLDRRSCQAYYGKEKKDGHKGWGKITDYEDMLTKEQQEETNFEKYSYNTRNNGTKSKRINDFIRNNGKFLLLLCIVFIVVVKLQFDIIHLNERLLISDLEITQRTNDVEDLRYYIHILEKRFITLGGDVTEWGCKRNHLQNLDNDDEDDDPSINHVQLLSMEAMKKAYESKFNPNFDEPSKCIKEEMKIFPMKLMCSKMSYNYKEKYLSQIDMYLDHEQDSIENPSYPTSQHSIEGQKISSESGNDSSNSSVNSNKVKYISNGLMNFDHSEVTLFQEVLLESNLVIAPSFGASWGDYNNDGFMDLYIGNHYWYPSLYENLNGTGFREVSDEILPDTVNNKFLDKHSSAWADFDKDGYVDLLECTGALYGTSSIPNNFYINKGGGKEKFREESVQRGIDYPLARGRMVTWIDYDKDGYLDAFLSSQKRADGEGKSALFRQNPKTHTFSDVTDKTEMDVDIKILFARETDLDNDGVLETFLVSFSFPYKVYHSSPDKPFKDVTHRFFAFNATVGESHKEYSKNSTVWIPPPPESGFYALITDLVFGDMDLNGYQDIIFARNYNGVCFITVLFNMGSDPEGKYAVVWERLDVYESNETQCGSLAVADFDNDFNMDIFMVTYLPFANSPNVYVANKGNREFNVKLDGFGAAGTTFGKGESVAIADYDNDGYLDLFITNGKGGVPFDIGPSQLFRNIGYGLTKVPRNWLEIDLIGMKDNAHGFGSRIIIKSCKTSQFRDVDTGVHFSCQNSFRVHFGLSHCPTVSEIKIYWSGSKKFQILKNVKANQILRIEEQWDD